jgi:hypothetical protein
MKTDRIDFKTCENMDKKSRKTMEWVSRGYDRNFMSRLPKMTKNVNFASAH